MSDPSPLIDPSNDVVALARQLCSIPSVSGDEQLIADTVERHVARAEHLELTREGNTLIARTALGRPMRVLIAGHLDTVPTGAADSTYEADDPVSGARLLWGRGTVDMKSGVAAQLKVALELADPRFDVTWVWYDQEEVASHLNGLGRVQRAYPELLQADFAILGEPSNAGLEAGCNGTLRARVGVSGTRAHSARNWTGVNAIERAAALLSRVRDFAAERIIVDGLEFREGLTTVGISGGVAGNVVPDRCEMVVNYRFAPTKTPEDAAGFVRNFFADADDVEIEDIAPGALPALADPLVESLIRAVGAAPVAKQGWTDVARFASLGIPAMNYGPGDPELAHTDDERVPTVQIEAVYATLGAWLRHAGERGDFARARN